MLSLFSKAVHRSRLSFPSHFYDLPALCTSDAFIASSLTTSMQARGHTQFPGSHPVSLNRFYLFEPLNHVLICYIDLINYTYKVGLLFHLLPHILCCVFFFFEW